MTDERYTFVSDVRDKKRTARGAFNKRTHCGKGGAVKFPSDFMSKKEIMAMNGEVKAYKLNDPMTWGEFKSMPDDLKIGYVKSLRERFSVSDAEIGRMMGVSRSSVSSETKRLGIPSSNTRGRHVWDKDGWYAWCNGVKLEAANDAPEKNEIVEIKQVEQTAQTEQTPPTPPYQGKMMFCCGLYDALRTVASTLGDTKVNLMISWEVQE